MEALPLEILPDPVDLDQAVQHLERARDVHVAGPVDRPSCRRPQPHLLRGAGAHVVPQQESVDVPLDEAGQAGT